MAEASYFNSQSPAIEKNENMQGTESFSEMQKMRNVNISVYRNRRTKTINIFICEKDEKGVAKNFKISQNDPSDTNRIDIADILERIKNSLISDNSEQIYNEENGGGYDDFSNLDNLEGINDSNSWVYSQDLVDSNVTTKFENDIYLHSSEGRKLYVDEDDLRSLEALAIEKKNNFKNATITYLNNVNENPRPVGLQNSNINKNETEILIFESNFDDKTKINSIANEDRQNKISIYTHPLYLSLLDSDDDLIGTKNIYESDDKLCETIKAEITMILRPYMI
ncbi:hypothetical protein COBT_002644 [Conglomerata obtusa]